MRMGLLCLICCLYSGFAAAQAMPRPGKVMLFKGEQKAWHAKSKSWLGLREFWLAYAQENNGLTWGIRDSYPPFDLVQEFDTMLLQTPDGECLLEFFHERWRKANDVRRWDKAFDSFSGCATVFEY